jgi:hypothetical protein
MNACVIMHNMKIENEIKTPANTHVDHLADVDHQVPTVLIFSPCMQSFMSQMLITNCKITS